MVEPTGGKPEGVMVGGGGRGVFWNPHAETILLIMDKTNMSFGMVIFPRMEASYRLKRVESIIPSSWK